MNELKPAGMPAKRLSHWAATGRFWPNTAGRLFGVYRPVSGNALAAVTAGVAGACEQTPVSGADFPGKVRESCRVTELHRG